MQKEQASWALMASAIVLTGLLILSLRGRFAPVAAAQASMVAPYGDYVLMTARLTGATAGDERLFVIDNPRHTLLVYNVNTRSGRLDLELAQDLQLVFAAITRQPVETPQERVPR
jgi:hypothetical protein